MQQELPKLTISVKEAAAMIGMSQRTIRLLVKNGEITVARIGTRVLFPVHELQRFIDEHTAVEPQAEHP